MNKSILNPNTDIPMYKQLSHILLRKIEEGVYAPGSKLPSESEMIKTYGVSRITVRSAIGELIEDGVLNSIKGKGSFVATPKALYTADDHYGFTRSCQIAGKIATTRVINKDLVYPPASIASFLNVPPTEKIIMIQRLRYVDGQELLIETNHYPMSFSFLLNEDLDASLFDLLGQKYNITVSRSIRTLEACMPTEDEARILNISMDTPLLLFKDKHLNRQEEPLFVSKQVYCSEKLKFYL